MTEQPSAKLEPCPFCGAAAETNNKGHGANCSSRECGGYYITCNVAEWNLRVATPSGAETARLRENGPVPLSDWQKMQAEVETLRRYNAELQALRQRQNTKILQLNQVVATLRELLEQGRTGLRHRDWLERTHKVLLATRHLPHQQPEDPSQEEIEL